MAWKHARRISIMEVGMVKNKAYYSSMALSNEANSPAKDKAIDLEKAVNSRKRDIARRQISIRGEDNRF